MATIKNIVQTVFTSKGAKNTAQDVSQIDRNMTRLAQSSASAGRSFSAQSQGLGGLVAAYAGAAATTFALQQAFDKLAQSARAIQTVEGLTTLAAESGNSASSILKSVGEITKGQLSIVESAQQANLALSAGFDSTQIEGLAGVALKASRALGRDLNDAYTRVIRGSAKLETELLDELGIYTKIDPATRAYAAAIGKARNELTEFERRQAFVNSVIAEGERKYASINTTVPTAAEKIEAFGKTIQNLATDLGSLLAEAVAPLAEYFSTNLVASLSAFGGIVGLVAAKSISVLRGGIELLGAKMLEVSATAEQTARSFIGMGTASRTAAAAFSDYSRELLTKDEASKTRFKELQKLASQQRLGFDNTKEAIKLLESEKLAANSYGKTVKTNINNLEQQILKTKANIGERERLRKSTSGLEKQLDRYTQQLKREQSQLESYNSTIAAANNTTKALSATMTTSGKIARSFGASIAFASTQVKLLAASVTSLFGLATGLFTFTTIFTFIGSSIAGAAGKAEEFDAYVRAIGDNLKSLFFNQDVIDDTDALLSLTGAALENLENLDKSLKDTESFTIEGEFLFNSVSIEKSKNLLVKEVSNALALAGEQGSKTFFQALFSKEAAVGGIAGLIVTGILGAIPIIGPRIASVLGPKLGAVIGTAIGAAVSKASSEAVKQISESRVRELEQFANLDPGILANNERLREAAAILSNQYGSLQDLNDETRRYLRTQLQLVASFDANIDNVETLIGLTEELGLSASELEKRFKSISEVGPLTIIDPDLDFLGQELEATIRIITIDDSAIDNVQDTISNMLSNLDASPRSFGRQLMDSLSGSQATLGQELAELKEEFETAMITLEGTISGISTTHIQYALREYKEAVDEYNNLINNPADLSFKASTNSIADILESSHILPINEAFNKIDEITQKAIINALRSGEELTEVLSFPNLPESLSEFIDTYELALNGLDTTSERVINRQKELLEAAEEAIGTALNRVSQKQQDYLNEVQTEVRKVKLPDVATAQQDFEDATQAITDFADSFNLLNTNFEETARGTAIFTNSLYNLNEAASAPGATLEQINQAQASMGAALLNLGSQAVISQEKIDKFEDSLVAIKDLPTKDLEGIFGVSGQDEINAVLEQFDLFLLAVKEAKIALEEQQDAAQAAAKETADRLEPLKEEIALRDRLIEQNKALSKPVEVSYGSDKEELDTRLAEQASVLTAERLEALQAQVAFEEKIRSIGELSVVQAQALLQANEHNKDEIIESLNIQGSLKEGLEKIVFLTQEQTIQAESTTLAYENQIAILNQMRPKVNSILQGWKQTISTMESDLKEFLAKDRIAKIKLEAENVQLDFQIDQQKLQNELSVIEGNIEVMQAKEDAGLVGALEAAEYIADANKQAIDLQVQLENSRYEAVQAELNTREQILLAEASIARSQLESEQALAVAKIQSDAQFIQSYVDAANGLVQGIDSSNKELVGALGRLFTQLTHGIANAFPSMIGELEVSGGDGSDISASYSSTIKQIENTYKATASAAIEATNTFFDAQITALSESTDLSLQNIEKERELERLKHDEKINNITAEGVAQEIADQKAIEDAKKGSGGGSGGGGGGGAGEEPDFDAAIEKIREAQEQIKGFIEEVLSAVSEAINLVGTQLQAVKELELEGILAQEELIKDNLANTSERLSDVQSRLNEALATETTLKQELADSTTVLAEAQEAFLAALTEGDVTSAAQELTTAIIDRSRKILELDRAVTERIALEGQAQSLEEQKIAQEEALTSITNKRIQAEAELERIQTATQALTELLSISFEALNLKLAETAQQIAAILELGGLPEIPEQFDEGLTELADAVNLINTQGQDLVEKSSEALTGATDEVLNSAGESLSDFASNLLVTGAKVLSGALSGANIGNTIGALIGDETFASTLGGALGGVAAALLSKTITSAVGIIAGSLINFALPVIGSLIFGLLFGGKKTPKGIVEGTINESGFEVTDTSKDDGFGQDAIDSISSVIDQVYEGTISSLQAAGISFLDSFDVYVKNVNGKFKEISTSVAVSAEEILAVTQGLEDIEPVDVTKVTTSAGKSAEELSEALADQFFQSIRLIRDESGAVVFRSLVVDALTPNREDLQQAIDTFAEIEDLSSKTASEFDRFVQFAQEFSNTIASLKGPSLSLADSLDLIAESAEINAKTLATTYKEFLSDTAEIFGSSSDQYDEATAAVRANALSQLGLTENTEGMIVAISDLDQSISAGQLSVERIIKSIDALTDITLPELGFSQEEISELNLAALEEQLLGFVNGFADSIEQSVAVLEDPTMQAVYTIEELVASSQGIYNEALGVVQGIEDNIAAQNELISTGPDQLNTLMAEQSQLESEITQLQPQAEYDPAAALVLDTLEDELASVNSEIVSLENSLASASDESNILNEALGISQEALAASAELASEQLNAALKELSIAELQRLQTVDLVGDEISVLTDEEAQAAVEAELLSRELSKLTEVSQDVIDMIMELDDAYEEITGTISGAVTMLGSVTATEIADIFEGLDTDEFAVEVTNAINELWEVGGNVEDEWSDLVATLDAGLADQTITASEYNEAMLLAADATLTQIEYTEDLAAAYEDVTNEILDLFGDMQDDLYDTINQLSDDLVSLLDSVLESTQTILQLYDDTFVDVAESGNELFNLKDTAREAFEESARAVEEFEKANSLSGKTADEVRAALEGVEDQIASLTSGDELSFSSFAELASLSSEQNKLSRELDNLLSVEAEYNDLLTTRQKASEDLAFAESTIQSLGDNLIDTRRTESELIQEVQDTVVQFTKAQEDLQEITEILAENNFNLNQLRSDENDRVLQVSEAIAQLNEDTEALLYTANTITDDETLAAILDPLYAELENTELDTSAIQEQIDLITAIFEEELVPLADSIIAWLDPTSQAAQDGADSFTEVTDELLVLTDSFQQFSSDLVKYLDTEGLAQFYGPDGIFKEFRDSLEATLITDGFEILTVSGGPLENFSNILYGIGTAINFLVDNGSYLDLSFKTLSQSGLTLTQAFGTGSDGLTAAFNGLVVTSDITKREINDLALEIDGFKVVIDEFNNLGVTYSPTEDFNRIITSIETFDVELGNISVDTSIDAAINDILTSINLFNSEVGNIDVNTSVSSSANDVVTAIGVFESTVGDITIENAINGLVNNIVSHVEAVDAVIGNITFNNTVQDVREDIVSSVRALRSTIRNININNAVAGTTKNIISAVEAIDSTIESITIGNTVEGVTGDVINAFNFLEDSIIGDIDVKNTINGLAGDIITAISTFNSTVGDISVQGVVAGEAKDIVFALETFESTIGDVDVTESVDGVADNIINSIYIFESTLGTVNVENQVKGAADSIINSVEIAFSDVEAISISNSVQGVAWDIVSVVDVFESTVGDITVENEVEGLANSIVDIIDSYNSTVASIKVSARPSNLADRLDTIITNYNSYVGDISVDVAPSDIGGDLTTIISSYNSDVASITVSTRPTALAGRLTTIIEQYEARVNKITVSTNALDVAKDIATVVSTYDSEVGSITVSTEAERVGGDIATVVGTYDSIVGDITVSTRPTALAGRLDTIIEQYGAQVGNITVSTNAVDVANDIATVVDTYDSTVGDITISTEAERVGGDIATVVSTYNSIVGDITVSTRPTALAGRLDTIIEQYGSQVGNITVSTNAVDVAKDVVTVISSYESTIGSIIISNDLVNVGGDIVTVISSYNSIIDSITVSNNITGVANDVVTVIEAYESTIGSITVSNNVTGVAKRVETVIDVYNSTIGDITVNNTVTGVARSIRNYINTYNSTINSITVSNNVIGVAREVSTYIRGYNSTINSINVSSRASDLATRTSIITTQYNKKLANVNVSARPSHLANRTSRIYTQHNKVLNNISVSNSASSLANQVKSSLQSHNQILNSVGVSARATNLANRLDDILSQYNNIVAQIVIDINASDLAWTIYDHIDAYEQALKAISINTWPKTYAQQIAGHIDAYENTLSNIDLTGVDNDIESIVDYVSDSINTIFNDIEAALGGDTAVSTIDSFVTSLTDLNAAFVELVNAGIDPNGETAVESELDQLINQFNSLGTSLEAIDTAALDATEDILTQVINDISNLDTNLSDISVTTALSSSDSDNLQTIANNSNKFPAIDGVDYSLSQFSNTYSRGGIVEGPGTSTSDSIPARLSKGEFVVKASTVSKIGSDILESINETGDLSHVMSSYGRFGDSLVAHINKREARSLRNEGGSGTINPRTGFLEFFAAQTASGAVGKNFSEQEADAIYTAFKAAVEGVNFALEQPTGKDYHTLGLFSDKVPINVYNSLQARIKDANNIELKKLHLIKNGEFSADAVDYSEVDSSNRWGKADMADTSQYEKLGGLTVAIADMLKNIGDARGIARDYFANVFGVNDYANTRNFMGIGGSGSKQYPGIDSSALRARSVNALEFFNSVVGASSATSTSQDFSKQSIKSQLDALNTKYGNFTDFYMLDGVKPRNLIYDSSSPYVNSRDLREIIDEEAYASGGLVTGGRDNVRSLLQPGEFVLRKPAVDKMGVAEAYRINATGDSNTGDNKVEVNITNNGTPQQTVNEPQVRRENGKLVIDIALEDIRNNGPLKRAIRSIK